MIFLFSLLIMGWGYGISRFILRAKDNRFYIFFPLGLAVMGTISTQLWLLGFRFQWISLATQAIGWTLLPLLLSEVWLRIQKRKLQNKSTFIALWEKLFSTTFSFFELPWIFLIGAAIFSTAILTMWSWSIFPIHWDNVSLYDFRAQQIAIGWQQADFRVSESTHPQLKLYDWHHPWFSSQVFALAYSFGVKNVSPLYWLLGLSVFWHVIGTWKSWRARTFILSNLVLIPSFFIAFTEGYAVISAVLFWIHFFLYTRKTPVLTRKSAVYLSFFALAAMQSRVAEPYWIPVMLWFIWYYRNQLFTACSTVLLIVAAQLEWLYLSYQAQQAFGFEPSQLSPTYAFLSHGTQGVTVLSILSLLKIFLFSPATFLSVGVFIAGVLLRKRVTLWWRSMSIVLGACLVILLGGMSVFAFHNPQGWQDIQLALPRASMPIIALALILLTDLFQESEDSTRMQ